MHRPSSDTVRSVWLALLSVGLSFSVIAWVLPRFSSFYVKAVLGLQIVIAVPLVVRFAAERIVLSGRGLRLYKVWFVLLLPLYVVLGTVVPIDAVTSARVFAVGFVATLVLAVVLVSLDVDETLWRLVDDGNG